MVDEVLLQTNRDDFEFISPSLTGTLISIFVSEGQCQFGFNVLSKLAGNALRLFTSVTHPNNRGRALPSPTSARIEVDG